MCEPSRPSVEILVGIGQDQIFWVSGLLHSDLVVRPTVPFQAESFSWWFFEVIRPARPVCFTDPPNSTRPSSSWDGKAGLLLSTLGEGTLRPVNAHLFFPFFFTPS